MATAMTVHGATCTCPLHRACRCGFHRRPCDCGGMRERIAAELLRCARCHEVAPPAEEVAPPGGTGAPSEAG
jgi:hypothetical protein